MIIVFVVPSGEYVGYKDALKCAKAFSGGEVYSIAHADFGIVQHVPIQDYLPACSDMIKAFNSRWPEPKWQYNLMSYIRWYVISEFMRRNKLAYPVHTPDWDLLIFRNSDKAYEPFSVYDHTMGGSSYHVAHEAVFQNFREITMRSLRYREHEHPTDMTVWTRLASNKTYFWGPVDGSLFDINMHLEQRCEMDRNSEQYSGRISKVVRWIDGLPHFVEKSSGQPVKANCIHCWGAYKSKTAELVKKAGL